MAPTMIHESLLTRSELADLRGKGWLWYRADHHWWLVAPETAEAAEVRASQKP